MRHFSIALYNIFDLEESLDAIKAATPVIKKILLLITGVAAFIASNDSSRSKILYKAIEKCRITGLQGTYESKICKLRDKFLHPDLFGPLEEIENIIVLHGKTGNGKSLISKHIANECNVQLVEIDCSNFYNDPQKAFSYLDTIFG